jgi:hypothetical protein
VVDCGCESDGAVDAVALGDGCEEPCGRAEACNFASVAPGLSGSSVIKSVDCRAAPDTLSVDCCIPEACWADAAVPEIAQSNTRLEAIRCTSSFPTCMDTPDAT